MPSGIYLHKSPSEETRRKMSLAHKKEKNGMWKGEDVSYNALHSWVRRRKSKPELCENCNKNKSIDLANISGQYKREINDFEWLCRSCHMKKDGRINNLKHIKYSRQYFIDKAKDKIPSYKILNINEWSGLYRFFKSVKEWKEAVIEYNKIKGENYDFK